MYRIIRAVLCISEEVRRCLWELTEKYTLLINQLLHEVSQDENFPTWQKKGRISKDAVNKILDRSKKDTRFKDLPSEFYLSASETVTRCYKSWLALQKIRYHRLTGKQQWAELIANEIALAVTTNFTLQQIQEKAQDVLEEIKESQRQQMSNQGRSTRNGRRRKRKSQKAQFDQTLINALFHLYDTTEDILTHRAIFHLIKNDLEINEQEETPQELGKYLTAKQIEIKRLEQQLQSRLPKGRDPTGERFIQEVEAAVALAKHDGDPDKFETEFEDWLEQKQIRLFDSSHYPLIFESADDLYWSFEKKELEKPEDSYEKNQDNLSVSQASNGKADIFRKPRRIRTKKRKRTTEKRICVRFKSMGEYPFMIQCDRRQLPYFSQFLLDYQTHQSLSREDKFGMGLFLLHSATLLWKEDRNLHEKLKKQRKRHLKEHSTGETETSLDPVDVKPWNSHRLHLHCVIYDPLSSAEGTEQVRQEKLAEAEATLKRLQEKKKQSNVEHEQLRQNGALCLEEEASEENPHSKARKLRTTIHRLKNNPAPKRPNTPLYQGQEHIVLGICFGREHPVTVAIADTQQQMKLDSCSTEELLIYHRAKVKRVNQNVLAIKAKWKRRQGKRRSIPLELEYWFIIHLPSEESFVFLLLLHLRIEKTGHAPLLPGLQYQFLKFLPYVETLPILLLLNLDVTDINSDYRLVTRLHEQHQHNVLKRAQEQKQNRYKQGKSEANTRKNISRTIADATVELAMEVQAGKIVIPEFGDIRERVESTIRAEAQLKFPGNKMAQDQYAKAVRDSFHRWNYGALANAVRERAARAGIQVVAVHQPRKGTSEDKALEMALH